MALSKTDQQLLADHLVDTCQDDDVETDEDTLISAIRSCESDLRKAEKRIMRDDGSYSYSMVRNMDVKLRTQRPDYYDRNGMFRDRSPIVSEKLLHENPKVQATSCRTVYQQPKSTQNIREAVPLNEEDSDSSRDSSSNDSSSLLN